jgi:hypothetical protein
MATASYIYTADYGENSYYLIPKMTWSAAMNRATELGGHLVAINDWAEQEWLIDTFRPKLANKKDPIWIGLVRDRDNDTWEWLNGDPYDHDFYYENFWLQHELNDHAGIEDVAVMNWKGDSLGRWNDWKVRYNNKDYEAYGIVEIAPVPAPAAAWLLGAALVGVVGLRGVRKN